MKKLMLLSAATLCAVCLADGIDAKKEKELALKRAKTDEIRELRQKWFDATEGNNLALGIKYELTPKPDYRLTKDENDNVDLTDGLLTKSSDDKLWFIRQCVGWYDSDGHSYIKLDLGAVKQIDRTVIRLLGGTTSNFKFPSTITIHVSKDGKLFYPASSMQKLQPCESDLCDWKTSFFLDETREGYNTYTYPFSLDVQADARYVIIEIQASTGSIFSDELAIMEATAKGDDYNKAYTKDGKEIPMEGLIIRPRVPEIAIMRGLPAPQKLNIEDLRPDDVKKSDFGKLVMEFPKGITIINPADFTQENLADGGIKYTYDMAKSKGKSPVFYLNAEQNATGNVTTYAITQAGQQFKTVVPLKIVEPIEVKAPFKRLHISLSWMNENVGRSWPDFWNNWKRLGFNVVSTFPRYWWNDASVKEGQEYVKTAHDAGFPIIMNDSAFHEMVKGHKAGDEIYCQIPGNDKHTWLCPSYRGKFYEKEMARVQRCVKNSKTDFVFYDIEIWHNAKQSSSKCTRCQEAIKKSGLSQQEFLYKCGKEMLADLKAAVERGAKEAGIPTPQIGSYGRRADREAYAIERWVDLYPASVDMAQPSLYVCGRAKDVHDCIRSNHAVLKNKKILPWLTAGTYGEIESFRIEQMVLEALLNGSMGITYFQASDFYDSPLDFYYHAKALAQVQPYEDLIVDGKITDIANDNENMTYSVVQKGNELLLLVGNYQGAKPKVTVTLPFKPSVIRDLRATNNAELKPGANFTFDVPKNDIRLFYIAK